ncbi:MAG: rRNA maturation RNase YbeY [Patescibacteria group bacterium]
MNGLVVAFQNESDVKVSESGLKETSSFILRRLKRLDRVKIELVVTGDKKIKTLNKQFRHLDEPTDVLSFPASDPTDEAGEAFLGSIIISAETAAKQAKLAGITLQKELQTLTGHGLLHLLGYHHR